MSGGGTIVITVPVGGVLSEPSTILLDGAATTLVPPSFPVIAEGATLEVRLGADQQGGSGGSIDVRYGSVAVRFLPR